MTVYMLETICIILFIVASFTILYSVLSSRALWRAALESKLDKAEIRMLNEAICRGNQYLKELKAEIKSLKGDMKK